MPRFVKAGISAGVVIPTGQRPRQVAVSQEARDFLGKGRLRVSGGTPASDRCVKLINDWIWCSFVGKAILEEIFAGPRSVGFIVVDAAEAAGGEMETSLPDEVDAKAAVGAGEVRIVLGPNLGVVERLNPPILQVPSSAVAHLRCEFVLMHELAHANRIARGKVHVGAMDDGSGNREEKIAIALTNMLMSEKGVQKLRKSYDSAEALDADPGKFVQTPANAEIVRIIARDHPILKQRLNNDISPVPFNPIFALLQGR